MSAGEGDKNWGWRLTCVAFAWLVGVVLHLQQAVLWPDLGYVGLAALGACILAAVWRWPRAFWLALIGVAMLGCGVSGMRGASRWMQGLAPELEGRDLVVTGLIAGLPQRGASGLRFRFEVEEALLRGQHVSVPVSLALGWYKGFHEDAVLSQPQQQLAAGQRWRFTVRLRQPHGNQNPHGFDYELYLFEQGVRATGYVRDEPAQLLHRSAGHPIERMRQHVRDAIDAAVPEPRAAGVLAALSVGDQSAIDRDDWELFRRTGTAHLVSISGLHVTMFAWLAGLGVGALWRRSEAAMLRLPAPLAARWGGFAAALGYALLSGWGIPSQRTVWMLGAIALLQTLGRRWPWPLVLLTAAVVVTAFDPWALLQAGFWLSFAAVGLLMASELATPDGPPSDTGFGAWRRAALELWRHARRGIRTQLVATIGLAPLSLVVFQQVSLVGLVANLGAIPLVTLVITPLALLGIGAAPLWWLGAWLVQQMSTALEWLAALPGAVWVVPVAPPWAQVAGLVAAALVLLPVPWRVRALAIPLVVPLLMPVPDVPTEGRFELLAADVGQGTSVLVRTRNHLLLYDTGPQYSRESDAGQRVLLPLLRSRGDTRIDRLMLSHRDADHVGGARSVLQATQVDELTSSLEEGHPLQALARTRTRCAGGQSWEWDGVRFDVLHPPAPAYATSAKPNAMSCVLRVRSALSGAALLAGDIGREQEAALVAAHGEGLRSDVLIAPHHGSRTSSSESFLDAVRPQVAVFQAGYRNRFGHPAPDVLARYFDRGITAVASPSCGAWHWREGTGVCERDASRRYWHHRGGAELP